MRVSNDTDIDTGHHLGRTQEMVYSILAVAMAICTEAHSFLAAKFPALEEGVKMDLFWSPSFKMDIDVLWYINMIFEALFVITILFIGASGFFRSSKKLFYVFTILLLYKIIDFFSFCWNFKQTVGMYWVLLLSATIILIIIFKRNVMRAV